ncbi:MAG: glycosyltransferase N-terminal domain-containing protein [Bacteroidota bacterium]|nr:glycosyltransferase N-terminal domain-containing protein [Bacteroidota bacterium]
MIVFQLLYNIFIVPLLWISFHIGGLINKKIKIGIEGRRNLFEQLISNSSKLNTSPRVWFHASSLGEFEQAKPIIALLKNRYPSINIIATFFSPSGFENSKNYKPSSIISYIPFDSYSNVHKFIDIVKPNVAVMVRYDIWPNMIFALKSKSIPTMIANATMPQNSLRKFPFIIQFHQILYNCFSHILTVSTKDELSFRDFQTTNPVIKSIGDTRFDQVLMRGEDARQKNLFANSVIEGKKIFIVGQSWGGDDDVIIPVLFKIQKLESQLLTIIVPHEPTVEHLEELESKLEENISFIRFSEMNNYNNQKVILIDSVGILVALYKYAHVVYIGGSFKQGIHNVLEPAVFGNPIIFGPKHTNSQEAVELARRGGGFIVENEKELYRTLRTLLVNQTDRAAAASISKAFVYDNCGATERFLQYLEPYLK